MFGNPYGLLVEIGHIGLLYNDETNKYIMKKKKYCYNIFTY